MSTPFLIVRPWNFAHVFNVPLPSLLLMCFFCFGFFSPKMWGLLRPKYPKKDTKTQISQKRYKDPNIWREKKNKKTLKARQRHTKQVCKISGYNSQKRRGHCHLKEFGLLCLNQPVLSCCGKHTGSPHQKPHMLICVVPSMVSDEYSTTYYWWWCRLRSTLRATAPDLLCKTPPCVHKV